MKEAVINCYLAFLRHHVSISRSLGHVLHSGNLAVLPFDVAKQVRQPSLVLNDRVITVVSVGLVESPLPVDPQPELDVCLTS